MSEKNFWTLVRKSLPLKMYRVENRVAKGMPDVHYLKDGNSGWVELKYLKQWPKTRMSVGLRQNQYIWHKQYRAENGKCWVLIRIGRDFTALFDGMLSQELFKRPSRKDFVEMASWCKFGNLTKEDWEELAGILIKNLDEIPSNIP